MKPIVRIMQRLRLNRLQRLMLLGAATLWFLSIVVSKQRNYQDSWILDSILWPCVGFVLTFLVILWLEDDNRFVAIICGWAVIGISLVPSLKYTQPYGKTIDSVIHYLMIEDLMTRGSVTSPSTYQAIAGMHSWLASIGLMSGLSASEMVKFGFPLLGGMMPLLIYWICKRIQMPTDLTKYVISLSCLTIYPYHMNTGTGFTLTPLVLFLGALVVREYYCNSRSEKIIYTLIALITLVQITFWHTTTPILLVILLISISLIPVLPWLATGRKEKVNLTVRFFQMSIVATVLLLGYHSIETDPVFQHVVTRLYQLIIADRNEVEVLPSSLFRISLIEAMRVFLLLYGREAIMFFLTAIGIFVVWRNRSRFKSLLHFLSFVAIILLTFIAAFPVSFMGIDYGRFLWVPLALTPFFAGFALWWWMQKVENIGTTYRLAIRCISVLVIMTVTGFFVMEFYNCQPLVPKSKSLAPDTPNEYIVWFHHVNTAYQERMITFAETHSNPDTQFDIDVAGNRQYLRYYGEYNNRGLYLPLEPKMLWLDRRTVKNDKLFLLHWPGIAGGYYENVTKRSVLYLTELRNTKGWGLIYDNGESFILHIPESSP